MKFKKIFITGIFLMLMFLCIACASAGDVNDTTLKTGTDTIKSTDLNGAATDNSKAINADNEIIGISSENDTKSKDNIIASSQDNNKLGNETPRTFTQLRDDIAATEGDVFEMQHNYKYDATADRSLNVGTTTPWITKLVTINGNGYLIDTSNYNNANLFFYNVLRFNNVQFKSAQAISYKDCNLTNCCFSDCFSGGGLNVNVINCKFYNIICPVNRVVLDNIYNIINCSFKNITTTNPIIKFSSNTVTSLKNCSFEDIYVNKNGDVMYSVIDGHRGTSNNNIYVDDCIFINCNSYISLFRNYQSTQSGGYNRGRLCINNCIFINNTLSEAYFAIIPGSVSQYVNAIIVNNSVFYLNKNVKIFNARTDYCSASNNTIIAGKYSLDSDVEDSVINFTYSGLSSSVSASRSSLVTSKFDLDQCFVYVNGLPNNNQRFNLVVRDINGTVVLTGSVLSDENGKGSFDCSNLDMGNYTYTVYHNTYNRVLDFFV